MEARQCKKSESRKSSRFANSAEEKQSNFLLSGPKSGVDTQKGWGMLLHTHLSTLHFLGGAARSAISNQPFSSEISAIVQSLFAKREKRQREQQKCMPTSRKFKTQFFLNDIHLVCIFFVCLLQLCVQMLNFCSSV